MGMGQAMKPFSLEEAKAGHPLITRDGRPAKFVAHVPSLHTHCCLLAEIDGYLVNARPDGLHAAAANNPLDLFMAPRKVVKWAQ